MVNIKKKHEFGMGTRDAGFMLCYYDYYYYYYYYYYYIKLNLVIRDLFLLLSLSVCVISEGVNNIL